MTRLSAPIKASMKKTATALTLACSLLSVMSISQAQAADNIDVSFQTILQQERNWAGLQSKSLKVVISLGHIVKVALAQSQLYYSFMA
ncbi:lipase domain protein [Acinetobacter baumannii 44437_9]|nr:lipase domain protein [Acinetobacter baumannii 44437_9]